MNPYTCNGGRLLHEYSEAESRACETRESVPLMKVSDIITYIMKIMGFGFKKMRSSSLRDIQKTLKVKI